VWPPSALESLRAQVRQIEGQHRRAFTALPFGVPAVDSRLPGGALPLGALHEIAGGGNGAIDGAAAALFAAGIAARTRGKVLWCLIRLDLFAPALAQAGLNSDRVIYLEAGDEKTILACFEEGLRHGGLGAVVGEVARLPMTASRRLQLAAEGQGRSASRFAVGGGRQKHPILASRRPPPRAGESRRCLRVLSPSRESGARAGSWN
jgi:protein ImuA